MASLSPFPHLCFDECKFKGTLVSNLLLPSSHERQTCQSNSSGSRRLNRGNCCTPKFSLPFPIDFSSQSPWRSGSSWGFICSRLLLALLTQIRVCVCTKMFWPKMPKMTFLLHIGLPSLSISSFKSWFQVLPSQLDSWPRNQLYWGKSQLYWGKSQLWPIYSQTS